MSNQSTTNPILDPNSMRPVLLEAASFSVDGAISSVAAANASQPSYYCTLDGEGKSWPWSSGGAYGSERSVCGAKQVNLVNNPATVHVSIVNSKNNSNSLTTFNHAMMGEYPPSPPEAHAEFVDGIVAATASKPLTMANVAAIPSSLSTISTSPTSDSESSSELSFSTSSTSSDALSTASSEAEIKFLGKVFGPSYNSTFAQHGVQISSTAGSTELQFPGAILTSAQHGTKALYISPSPSNMLTRDSLIELMDLAIDECNCTGMVICLDKSDDGLEETLHELMYVGGAIINPDAAMVGYNNTDYVLVGLDL